MRRKVKAFPWKGYHVPPAEIPRRLSRRIDEAAADVSLILALVRPLEHVLLIGALQGALGQLHEAQRQHVASLTER